MGLSVKFKRKSKKFVFFVLLFLILLLPFQLIVNMKPEVKLFNLWGNLKFDADLSHARPNSQAKPSSDDGF